MSEELNYNKLRKDLIDYFGTAMSVNPMAIIELIEVENASIEKLIAIALDNGFDLNDYIEIEKIKYLK